MIPWQLFDLNQRDATGVLLRAVNIQTSVSSAAASHLSGLLVVPMDNALLVSAFSVFADAGAAQVAQRANLSIRDIPGSHVQASIEHGFPVNGSGSIEPAIFTLSGSPLFIAGPNTNIVGVCEYNAGANVNSTVFNLCGILIPRGTMGYE